LSRPGADGMIAGMRVFRLRSLAFAAAALLAACGGEERAPVPGKATRTGGAPAGNAGRVRIGPYPRSEFVIAHDGFLAADEPRCVPATEARFLRDDDEVYGIVVTGKARAYAIAMLAYHHVVNDVMAGTPVAVTY